MQINAYLQFNGQCEAAFKFYAQCLGGKITDMIPFGQTPAAEHVPADLRGQIMHARLEVGSQVLMGADATPTCPYEGVKGCSVALHVADTAEGERLFRVLSEGGTVQMPFQETFWAAGFGAAVDRFGVPWLINCQKPA